MTSSDEQASAAKCSDAPLSLSRVCVCVSLAGHHWSDEALSPVGGLLPLVCMHAMRERVLALAWPGLMLTPYCSLRAPLVCPWALHVSPSHITAARDGQGRLRE